MANDRAQNLTNAGFNKARTNINSGFDQAQGFLEPFAASGQRGFDLFQDSIGVNGQPGFDRAFSTFQGDPFREFANQDTENRLTDLFRRYNAQGLADSGASRLAAGRVAGEFARRDVNDFRDRLAGSGQTGLNIAGQQANLATNRATNLANLDTRQGLTNAGREISFGNAMASSRSTGLNNLLALGGTVLSGFAPTANGTSAFGNIGKSFF